MSHSFDNFNKFYPVFKQDLIYLREEKAYRKFGFNYIPMKN